jgi:hypothetical protein
MVNAVQGVKLFLWFLKGIGKERIEEVTRADLEAFVEHEQDRGLKLLSVRTYLACATSLIMTAFLIKIR